MLLPLLLVLAPIVAGLIALLVSWIRGSPYAAFGDQVYIELHVRDIGSHAVLTGPFSRYGWAHPGPAMYYLLAPLYWLTGTSEQSLAITPLLVNGGCVVAIALLVRRRAGTAAALWSLLVLAVYLRVFGAGPLRNNWNPDLPVLPTALLAFLSWSLACGSRWALPGVVALASFAVESHTGFVPAVGACLLVAAGALAVRAVAARARRGGPERQEADAGPPEPVQAAAGWRRPVLVAAGILVVMWLPPIIDAIAHSGGNLRALIHYFTTATPTGSWSGGLSWVNSDIGALPAYVAGIDRTAPTATQPGLPGWTGALALVALAATVALAVRRRSRESAVLAAIAAALCLAGVFAVRRIVGPPFDYLAAWVLDAGIVLWTALGVALLGRDGAPAAAGRGRLWAGRAGWAGWGAAVAALAGVAVVAAPAEATVVTPWTYTDGVTADLDHQVLSWLGPHQGELVRVDSAGRGNDLTSIIAANNRASALLMALDRSGVAVRVSPYFVGAYGAPRGKDLGAVRWVLLVVQGSRAGQRGDLVARSGGWFVYATPGPGG